MGVFSMFGGKGYEPSQKMGFSSAESCTQNNSKNPNPKNFEILQKYQIRFGIKYPILVKIKYPNCTNYEGVKILIFKTRRYLEECIRNNDLDPHFFPESELICRVHPRSWELGKKLLKVIHENN